MNTQTSMPQPSFIKRIASYLLMGTGVIAIAAVAVVAVIEFLPRGEHRQDQPRVGMPMGGAPFSKSLFAPESAPKMAERSISASALPAHEGELTQRKITKHGTLSLLVESVETAAGAIQSLAAKFNGLVVNASVREVSKGIQSGTVMIKVPSDQFEPAMAAVKKLAEKVENEEISTRDVTEEFVDLEGRLKNLRAEEAQYREIMKRANKVEDILKVSRELSDARGRIEQIEGELKFLSGQIEMSTITAYLTAEADVEVLGIRWKPLFVIKSAFRNLLEGLKGYVDALIRILFVLPVILLWVGTIAVAVIVGVCFTKWIYEKFIRKQLWKRKL